VPGIALTLGASDTCLGGNIAINLDPVADVFIGASFADSPWLSPDTPLDRGAVVVYSPAGGTRPLAALVDLHEDDGWKGTESLRWSSEKRPMLELVWGVIPPTEACSR